MERPLDLLVHPPRVGQKFRIPELKISMQWFGPAALFVFCLAYALVFAEEKLHLRKSKPVMIAASVIWILVALAFRAEGRGAEVGKLLNPVLLDFSKLFLFLLSAMSFVNTLVERNVFEVLRARISGLNLSARGIYWVVGVLAFVLSPIADNLTTALVVGAVAISAFGDDKKSTAAACVSIVIAANAGGAFSPFGDITTLMVWQSGTVQFGQFLDLFFPALVNWLLPALIISFTVSKATTLARHTDVKVRKGGWAIAILFLLTIAATVLLDHTLDLPPYLGMMMGLGGLNLFSYFLHRAEARQLIQDVESSSLEMQPDDRAQSGRPFSIFIILEKIEWDTLLFFYGIMLSVGGLGAFGYLHTLSSVLYGGLGATLANIFIGIISAIVDNIPLTFAVITMNPKMDLGQWLLLTLTAGVGGSLLSVGSAAGVALMGSARGAYTFTSHLKWTWAILLGFAAAVATHLLFNRHLFTP
jgi:Na+/H+ antiporter NhaD/arsenite permease-like protein